jgi:acyl-CoA reductase-like NAD-dependent aldehyde dehydrogenase
MRIINPATEELIREIPEDDPASVRQKFQLLKEGQTDWASRSVAERVNLIGAFAGLLEKHKDELAHLLTSEMGKPLQQSLNELNGAQQRIGFFLSQSEKYLAEEWVVPEGATKEKIVYEPLGVIVNISAWNYPYLVGVNVFIPALIGGNCVFYKPSEYTTLTGLRLAALFYEAGLPDHCFQVAVGGPSVGEALLDLAADGYFFTGSHKTGTYIAKKLAEKLVPVQLELGGKDPLYVMDDVKDVDATASDALEGVVYNNGQSCCAVERIYVHEKVYDAFLAAYLQQFKKLRIGSPLLPETDIGPLARKEQLGFLLGQIRDAVEKGARLAGGGKQIDGKGFYLEPAVLVDVDHRMKLMKEESFGPVVGIQKVRSDEEAAALMADTDYGLTASVYSASFERAEKLMKQMHTGTVYWNCCDRVSATAPWSGRKNSGIGSTLSYQGIRAFVQPKAYHIRAK